MALEVVTLPALFPQLCSVSSVSSISSCFTGPGSKDASVSPLAGRLIVVVGAGGAGKAIAYGAKEKGARVVVANRTYGKISTSQLMMFDVC
jgi:3-dehydroquinate dehydratase/shikimate dehydrogenase